LNSQEASGTLHGGESVKLPKQWPFILYWKSYRNYERTPEKISWGKFNILV